jgi:flagellar basal-body rod protein FlgB
MSDSLFSDSALRASMVALDGLSLRQQAISRNLANVDTPGYQAETVNFEDALKRITQSDGSLKLAATNAAHLTSSDTSQTGFSVVTRSGGSFRADQNNVDVDVEMTDMSEVGIQYQAISQAVSQKLLLLKTLAK